MNSASIPSSGRELCVVLIPCLTIVSAVKRVVASTTGNSSDSRGGTTASYHSLYCSGMLANHLLLPVSVAMKYNLDTLQGFSKRTRGHWQVH
jgi:hypothetical protein